MKEHMGYSELDKQYNAELVFFLFFIYVSFIHFFHLKENTTVTTDKQRAKRIQQKDIQQYGGQVAPNSI